MEIWTEALFLKKFEQGKKGVLFLYTPMCGTCHVAERMINIIDKLFPKMTIGKMDLNFYPEIANRFRIESVPCLLLFHKQTIVNKLYAFHSVPYLYQVMQSFKEYE